MPFRASFACLWCGADHVTRSPDDLEGWTQLCPTCVGKAGDNEFLRSRLRRALTERGRAATGTTGPAAPDPVPPAGPDADARPAPPLGASLDATRSAPPIDDDWYVRRGPASEGPIQDATFLAELDAAGRWLDALPLAGRITQLEAGSGWWAPLLASKGELTLLDRSTSALDVARERLVAHGLRAHLHVRDPWTAVDEQGADVVLLSLWLGRLDPTDIPTALGAARRHLRSGGRLVVIDALPGALPPPAPGLPDARLLAGALSDAGFAEVDAAVVGRNLLVATAIAAG